MSAAQQVADDAEVAPVEPGGLDTPVVVDNEAGSVGSLKARF